ncbi:SWI/SNF complex component [Salix suchowensis]|nr:SWI/SNF complex component [Salix suchowensis]
MSNVATNADAPKSAKKRKLTDKSIPNVILQNPAFAEDSAMYQNLLEMERKLDWTTTRKKAEVQDALGRNPTVSRLDTSILPTSQLSKTTRTLRLFLSHSTSGQVWQAGSDAVVPNFDTGEGVPAWTLKIDGRLLEAPNARSRDRIQPRKFSTLIKRMVVEMDRDPAVYPESNIVEVSMFASPLGSDHYTLLSVARASSHQNPVLDGFTIRRTGDVLTQIRLILFLDHMPEQFKVAPELAAVLSIKEESRVGVIQALWNYVKVQGLQDKSNRRIVRADDALKPIFGVESVPFHKLPEIVNRYLTAPDPVVIHYTLNPAIPPPERPSAWDMEVKIEDHTLKNRMTVMLQANKESAATLAKLDEEIALLAQSLHNSHLKRTFLQSFADDPAQFIQTWLESQSRDLESILGGAGEGAAVRAEELKRSEFFRLPWVEEAVAIHEGIRLSQKGIQ